MGVSVVATMEVGGVLYQYRSRLLLKNNARRDRSRSFKFRLFPIFTANIQDILQYEIEILPKLIVIEVMANIHRCTSCMPPHVVWELDLERKCSKVSVSAKPH